MSFHHSVNSKVITTLSLIFFQQSVVEFRIYKSYTQLSEKHSLFLKSPLTGCPQDSANVGLAEQKLSLTSQDGTLLTSIL